MDYGYDEEKNKRIQKIMDDFMLQIAEKEYIAKNGYSLRAEKFANSLITDGPDGVGLFVFEEGTPWEMWKYTKMLSMVAFEEKPATLYQTLDEIMNSYQEHTLTLMTIPFGQDGQSIDRTRQTATIYAVQGTFIRPFEEEELEEIASTVSDLSITFKKGKPWIYDAYEGYIKLEV